MNKYDPYEWTMIAANKPRKDMIYFDDGYTSQTIEADDPITYYSVNGSSKKILDGTIAAIDEKFVGDYYYMNLSVDFYDSFVGMSIMIPHKDYSDCYVTVSRPQETYKRPEKIVVSGNTYFRGTYYGLTIDDEYTENDTDPSIVKKYLGYYTNDCTTVACSSSSSNN